VIGHDFEFDPGKDRTNRLKHGIGLSDYRGFDALPIVVRDERSDYGEDRFRAFGRIGGVGYMIAYAAKGERFRLISFRRAHDKEMRQYGR
jgi:uncharacterized DUF497 family protein